MTYQISQYRKEIYVLKCKFLGVCIWKHYFTKDDFMEFYELKNHLFKTHVVISMIDDDVFELIVLRNRKVIFRQII